jgi:hypothetical protein
MAEKKDTKRKAGMGNDAEVSGSNAPTEPSTSGVFADKIKSSYYLDRKTEERILAIYIKRLHKNGKRPKKSTIVDEAIELLYQKECHGEDG